MIEYLESDERFLVDPDEFIITKKKSDESQKLNMNLGTFSTSQDLDNQLDDILKGIEPKVLAALGKTKYFKKEGDQ